MIDEYKQRPERDEDIPFENITGNETDGLPSFEEIYPKEKWIIVEFNCSNGWDKVITSIPESEKQNAKQYFEKQGYKDVNNINFK